MENIPEDLADKVREERQNPIRQKDLGFSNDICTSPGSDKAPTGEGAKITDKELLSFLLIKSTIGNIWFTDTGKRSEPLCLQTQKPTSRNVSLV